MDMLRGCYSTAASFLAMQVRMLQTLTQAGFCIKRKPERIRSDAPSHSTAVASSEFSRANNPQGQGRVQSFGEAGCVEGSQTLLRLKNAAAEIVEQIVKQREQAFAEKIGRPPKQLNGRTSLI